MIIVGSTGAGTEVIIVASLLVAVEDQVQK